jgi:hypothetical protein
VQVLHFSRLSVWLRRVSAAGSLLLVSLGADDVEELGVVEAGPPRRGVARGLERIDLHAGEVGDPRLHGLGVRVGVGDGGLGARAGGLAHGDPHPAVLRDPGVGLELPLGERDDVGVDAEGDDGGGGAVGELVHDERARGAVLEEEEHERVPDDALEHDDLDHERPRGVGAVHAPEQRDAHDERVGQRGEGEERDAPVEVEEGQPGEAGGDGEEREDDDLLERVGGEEAEVHLERVVGGDEVEGEQRDGEERHEAVDPRALVRGEDPPPPDGAVGERHGHVERHDGRQDVVQVERGDHGCRSSNPCLPCLCGRSRNELLVCNCERFMARKWRWSRKKSKDCRCWEDVLWSEGRTEERGGGDTDALWSERGEHGLHHRFAGCGNGTVRFLQLALHPTLQQVQCRGGTTR